MSQILNLIAASRYGHDAGVSGIVTVPTGARVTGIWAHTQSAASITITPGGAGQVATALTAIIMPANSEYTHPWLACLAQLGAGATINFNGTVSYVVTYAYPL